MGSSGAGTSEDPVSKPCSMQVQLDQAVEGHAQKRVEYVPGQRSHSQSGSLFQGLTTLTVKPVFPNIQLAFLSFHLVPCLPLVLPLPTSQRNLALSPSLPELSHGVAAGSLPLSSPLLRLNKPSSFEHCPLLDLNASILVLGSPKQHSHQM